MTRQNSSCTHRRLLTKAAALIAVGALVAPIAVARADTSTSLNRNIIPAAESPANPGPSITGFRGATFGMSENEVRHAIESGFNLPASAISAGYNAIQHTDVLTVTVPNLVPGGGTASVSYVFGYQTHKLIEVNVFWSPQIDSKITAQTLYQNGETLQQYFAGEGFPPDRTNGNVATQNGILLFSARDPSNNAVLLILSGTMTKDPKDPAKTALNPTALTLEYAENPAHPDIFQLSKGSF